MNIIELKITISEMKNPIKEFNSKLRQQKKQSMKLKQDGKKLCKPKNRGKKS